jgi:hypothetical protein
MAREFAIGSHFSRVSSDGTDPGRVTSTGDCAQNPVNELSRVESRTGAVTVASRWLVGWAFASPPQSGLAWPCFLFPLIEPDRQISRIRLSEKTHASWVSKEACDAVCNF